MTARPPLPSPVPPLLVEVLLDGASRARLVFDRDLVNVGRDLACHLHLPAPRVSRLHCRIERLRGQYVLGDANSQHGTRVNGAVVRSHVLRDGDVVAVGPFTLKIGFLDPSGLPRATSARHAALPTIGPETPGAGRL